MENLLNIFLHSYILIDLVSYIYKISVHKKQIY